MTRSPKCSSFGAEDAFHLLNVLHALSPELELTAKHTVTVRGMCIGCVPAVFAADPKLPGEATEVVDQKAVARSTTKENKIEAEKQPHTLSQNLWV